MSEKKGGRLAVIFVPFDEVPGSGSDPLEEILRLYVRCTGEIHYRYEQEKAKYLDKVTSQTQSELLHIHLKAMHDIIDLGYSPQAASEMLGRPTLDHFK
jgi:hypothetical protein